MNHDILPYWLMACGLVGTLISAVLYVMFNLLTVRRLRRDPQIRLRLGIALFPGGETVGIARTLTWPRAWVRRTDRKASDAIRPDPEALYRHTHAGERYLARTCYGLQVFSALLIFAAVASYVWI